MLGPAVQTCLLAFGIDFEAEFGGDDHFATNGSESLTHKFLVGVGAVYLCGIEEGNSSIDCGAEDGNSVLLIHGGSVAKTQTHATESDGRNFQCAFSQLASLHRLSCRIVTIDASNKVPEAFKKNLIWSRVLFEPSAMRPCLRAVVIPYRLQISSPE